MQTLCVYELSPNAIIFKKVMLINSSIIRLAEDKTMKTYVCHLIPIRSCV